MTQPTDKLQDAEDIDAYRTHMRAADKSPGTIRVRIWQLRRLSESRRGQLRSATTDELAAYIAQPGWSSATIYSWRATLRDFYRFLEDSGRVGRSPAAKLPPVRVRRPRLQPASEEAITEARTQDDRLRLMVDLGARQGLRRSEIAQIHSRDLVRGSDGWSLVVHGKGRKDRTIPLCPEVAEQLRRLPAGWAFPSTWSGGHLTPGHVGTLISKALPEGWTTHSLRRRFATQVYAGTRDIQAVQQLLGHSSIAITQVYLGDQPEALRNALAYA